MIFDLLARPFAWYDDPPFALRFGGKGGGSSAQQRPPAPIKPPPAPAPAAAVQSARRILASKRPRFGRQQTILTNAPKADSNSSTQRRTILGT
jgi:hypothetical protein